MNSTIYFSDNDKLGSDKVLNIITSYTKKKCLSRNIHYVEIGTFRGFSCINNAVKNTKVKCYTIDNFRFDKKNLEIFKFYKKKYKVNNLSLLNCDFEKAYDVLREKKIKIGTLFVDGPHDYRSQYIILERFKNLLTTNACIIIDDANYEHVKLATSDFLTNNNDFKLVGQYYSKIHPSLIDKNTAKKNKNNWNGLHIIERNSKKVGKKLKINLKKAKKFHIDSHDIQRHYFGRDTLQVLDELYKYFCNKNKNSIIKLKQLYSRNKKRSFKSNF